MPKLQPAISYDGTPIHNSFRIPGFNGDYYVVRDDSGGIDVRGTEDHGLLFRSELPYSVAKEDGGAPAAALVRAFHVGLARGETFGRNERQREVREALFGVLGLDAERVHGLDVGGDFKESRTVIVNARP